MLAVHTLQLGKDPVQFPGIFCFCEADQAPGVGGKPWRVVVASQAESDLVGIVVPGLAGYLATATAHASDEVN
jgi:hypothetical protein